MTGSNPGILGVTYAFIAVPTALYAATMYVLDLGICKIKWNIVELPQCQVVAYLFDSAETWTLVR
jgi:hypothetical protein